MRLNTFLHNLNIAIHEQNEIDISGIHFHSKKITPGNVFVAISGNQHDGHDYIEDAIASGASVIIGEKDISDLHVPYYRVACARKALADLAAHFYGYPAKKHKVIGITGTNGKTTTAFMLWHILQYAGFSSSLISTVSTFVNGKETASLSTTPDALFLQEILYRSDDDYVVMEVSSHGIDQQRIRSIDYDLAVFTNLSHEHLDYHKDMESYYRTKRILFNQVKENGYVLINIDCPWGEKLSEELSDQYNVTTFGVTDAEQSNVSLVKSNPLEGMFSIKDGTSVNEVRICLPGMHNIYNALAAFAAARKLGIEAAKIIEAFKSFEGIPGRFERFSHPSEATFVVDYAHTPDGVEHLLKTSRELCKHRLTHIFGFRGQRDTAKRIDMLRRSLSYSDRVILTTDDLNDENDLFMSIKKMTNELGSDKCEIIEDRTLAIKQAWHSVSQGDWVAITGKGPEPYKHSFILPTQTDKETIHYLLNQ